MPAASPKASCRAQSTGEPALSDARAGMGSSRSISSATSLPMRSRSAFVSRAMTRGWAYSFHWAVNRAYRRATSRMAASRSSCGMVSLGKAQLVDSRMEPQPSAVSPARLSTATRAVSSVVGKALGAPPACIFRPKSNWSRPKTS